MQAFAYRAVAAALINKRKPRLTALTGLTKLISLSHYCSAENRKPVSRLDDESEEEEGSVVYKRALKFQRPSVVKYQSHLYNSASFIGAVDSPLKISQFDNTDSSFCVTTKLRVKDFAHRNRPVLWTLVEMWDKLAEISLLHVKERDFIYVSGRLDCFTINTQHGKSKTHYKVVAKELNFVAEHPHLSTLRDFNKSLLERDDADMEQPKNPLHLWQVFFSNPFEWWDNRKAKKSLRQPDFKHKDTGEALWLRSDDPPWIKKQLQLLDSKMSAGMGDDLRSRSRVSAWEYDE